MTKRFEVHVLREAGHTQRHIQELTGVHERSVRRIQAEDLPTLFDDGQETRRRRIGRPSKTHAYIPLVLELLHEDPTMRTQELLRLAKEAGYTGQKSQFYQLVHQIRPPDPVTPMVRFEGLAGEFAQHDFGQTRIRFQDGTTKHTRFFATRLKYSRHAEVSIVPDERAETLVRTLVEHYERIGGIPLVSVFDRPATVCQEWRSDGTVTKWNPVFMEVAIQLGVGIDVCWPGRPQEKGSVENLVGWVKSSFFKPRVFHDEEDLHHQLAQWHEEANTKRPCRATKEVPSVRLVKELERMRPVKVRSEQLALRYPVKVSPTGFVTHGGAQYSMPPKSIGATGTLYLGRDSVRIEANGHTILHPRQASGGKSLLGDHREELAKSVKGRKGRLHLKREHIRELSLVAEEYLTSLVHRRPDSWSNDIEEMHGLLLEHGEVAFLEALAEAHRWEQVGAEYVRHHLGLGVENRGRGS